MQNKIYSTIHKLDSITYNHSIRVMCLAREIEDFYHFDNHLMSNAALVHDVGKFYITSKILDKKERLDLVERELINLHSYIGYKMLKEFGVNEDICRITLYHHGLRPIVLEKLDPYNNPLISDMAFMLHSIDSFEALTSDRPYHRGLLATEALDVMIKESNHHQAILDYIIYMTDNEELCDSSAIFRGGYSVEPHIIENVFNDICTKDIKVLNNFFVSAV